MKLIKLRTTESTNSFLKDLAKNTLVKDFTVVVTDEQISGRGQIENNWLSEPFKNLTFSVFVSFKKLEVKHQKYLNFAVSLAIFDVLKTLNLTSLSIKWPNDILSEKKKLCGILIENQFKGSKITSSVIGIGLNVNQTNFGALTKATSIKKLIQKDIILEDLLEQLTFELREKISLLRKKEFVLLEKNYLDHLYKLKKPSMFKDSYGTLFMGKIIGVTSEGKLQIELEDESIREFGIKEVVFV